MEQRSPAIPDNSWLDIDSENVHGRSQKNETSRSRNPSRSYRRNNAESGSWRSASRASPSKGKRASREQPFSTLSNFWASQAGAKAFSSRQQPMKYSDNDNKARYVSNNRRSATPVKNNENSARSGIRLNVASFAHAAAFASEPADDVPLNKYQMAAANMNRHVPAQPAASRTYQPTAHASPSTGQKHPPSTNSPLRTHLRQASTPSARIHQPKSPTRATNHMYSSPTPNLHHVAEEFTPKSKKDAYRRESRVDELRAKPMDRDAAYTSPYRRVPMQAEQSEIQKESPLNINRRGMPPSVHSMLSVEPTAPDESLMDTTPPHVEKVEHTSVSMLSPESSTRIDIFTSNSDEISTASSPSPNRNRKRESLVKQNGRSSIGMHSIASGPRWSLISDGSDTNASHTPGSVTSNNSSVSPSAPELPIDIERDTAGFDTPNRVDVSQSAPELPIENERDSTGSVTSNSGDVAPSAPELPINIEHTDANNVIPPLSENLDCSEDEMKTSSLGKAVASGEESTRSFITAQGNESILRSMSEEHNSVHHMSPTISVASLEDQSRENLVDSAGDESNAENSVASEKFAIGRVGESVGKSLSLMRDTRQVVPATQLYRAESESCTTSDDDQRDDETAVSLQFEPKTGGTTMLYTQHNPAPLYTKQDSGPSPTTAPLYGLDIYSPSNISCITNPTPCNQSEASRRVSFDFGNASNQVDDKSIEESHFSTRAPPIGNDQDDGIDMESGLYSRTSNVVSRSVWNVWAETINGEITRAANITKNELLHIRNVISVSTIRFLGLSDNLSNLRDLEYLQESHAEKMKQLFPEHAEDDFEFALVLTPQEVYAFWADLLDFQAEFLGVDYVSASTPKSGGMPTSTPRVEEVDHDIETNIGAASFGTPQTGLRNRSNHNINAPNTAPSKSSMERTIPDGRLQIDTSAKLASLSRRQSMFERALDSITPRSSSCQIDGETTPTPGIKENKKPTPSTHARRRWGNRGAMHPSNGTPDIASPPVRSLRRHASVRNRRVTYANPLSPSEMTVNTVGKKVKRHPNAIKIENIPTQVIPRGIAARSHGLDKFLSALKRGIVLRRHRPNAKPVFCKFSSSDGGDTIQVDYVPRHEAMLAFEDQRIRYNPKLAPKGANVIRSQSVKWNDQDELLDEDQENRHFSLPDHVAAEQYRKVQMEKKSKMKKRVAKMANKVAHRGTIRAAEMIAVHPARHEDPRSERNELGTASFRKSKAEYHIPFSFSIVTTAAPWISGQSDIHGAIEKWGDGKLSDVHYKSFDFEAATEGEYWLIFRGFLLLHRDACSGRFAKQRSAGFGNNVIEFQQKEEHDLGVPGYRLNKQAYLEPHTLSFFESLVSKIRKTDEAYTAGHADPDAIPPPSDYFLGYRSPGTEIWSRLRQAGLETQRIYGLDTRQVMIKIFCPSDRIMDVAEVLRLKLKARDGSFVAFRENDIGLFPPSKDSTSTLSADGASVFRSSHRQLIIDFIIRSRIRDSGAELGPNTDLGKLVGGRVPLHAREQLNTICDAWIYFWRQDNWIGRDGRDMSVEKMNMKSSEVHADKSHRSLLSAKEAFENEDESQTQDSANDMPNIFSRLLFGAFHQPLDSVEQYFGEKVAFYFAWLQHCSYHLTYLSAVGLLVFVIQMATNNWDHPIKPFFSTVIMLWSFVVLVHWRQRSNFLAHRWGTMNLKEQETTRPQFKGEYCQDEITGEWVVYYPKWKRWLKYLISLPLTLAFTFGTLLMILIVHSNRDLLLANYFEQQQNPGSEEFGFNLSISAIGEKAPLNAVEINSASARDPRFWVIIAGYPCALGLCLPLLNLVLMRISVMLNDFENYRTESEYRTHLIIKVFSFRFVCYFATLYYYAYVSIGTKQDIENGILRVGSGVMIYMTVSHWWSIFLSVYFPQLLFRIRQYYRRLRLVDELRQLELEEFMLSEAVEDDEQTKKTRLILKNKRILLEQAQNKVWDEVVLREHDSFPEYIQAIVQFAYVTCFSVVLPIAPIICLINHLLSMRLDAYKLCRGRRRPLAQKTGGIGVWEHVLHIVTVIAVLTNCFLMGFANTQFKNLSANIGDLGLFCVVVGWEHVMLLIKYIMSASVSKLPKCVRDDLKKEQYDMSKMRNSNMRVRKSRRAKRKKENDVDGMSTSMSMSYYDDDDDDETRSLCTMRSENVSKMSAHHISQVPMRPPLQTVAANMYSNRSKPQNHDHIRPKRTPVRSPALGTSLHSDFDSEADASADDNNLLPGNNFYGILSEEPSLESAEGQLYEA